MSRPLHGRSQTRRYPATACVTSQITTTQRRHLRAIVGMMMLAAAAVLATRASAQAPKYDVVAMHPALTEKVIADAERATGAYVRMGDGDMRMVGGYFRAYVPAVLTAPGQSEQMTKVVSDLSGFIDRISKTNRVDVFQKVTSEIYTGLKPVAEGNYNPTARIAAITLLARLDQQQANNASANKTPPVPLMAMLPSLMSIYENEKNVDGVRAAALQGIARHVSLNFPRIPADVRTKIVADMNKLLDSPAPLGRTDDVHAFLQRYAVDVLTMLRTRDDTTLGTKLIGISTKPNASRLIALHSAARVGDLGDQLKGKVPDPDKILKQWSALALKEFESEIARINALERVERAAKQPKNPSEFLNKTPNKTATTRGYEEGGPDSGDYGPDYGMEMGMEGMEAMGGGGMEDMYGPDYGMEGMMGGMYGAAAIPEPDPQPPEVIASRRRINRRSKNCT